MNNQLRNLARHLELDSPGMRQSCLTFGHACVGRVSHLLEEPEVILAWNALTRYLDGTLSDETFNSVAHRVLQLANQHRGSPSIDGTQHAAVSATFALANAINCKPIEAAEYCAYAKIYAYGAYALSDNELFEEEYAWQIECMQKCIVARPSNACREARR
jgi:hypothetical protein